MELPGEILELIVGHCFQETTESIDTLAALRCTCKQLKDIVDLQLERRTCISSKVFEGLLKKTLAYEMPIETVFYLTFYTAQKGYKDLCKQYLNEFSHRLKSIINSMDRPIDSIPHIVNQLQLGPGMSNTTIKYLSNTVHYLTVMGKREEARDLVYNTFYPKDLES